ncbi:hypothetical protein [Nocardioides pocheonensis]|uniref:Uncharacterized protein n=1 Tax=Nocardioides pocheonensis TaxID=661485 RepID=A0A3N0GIZ8_9ACTN|nr:hypothetical protein [Nocardioides pocheonensis]RNM12443.1 hypothetical protein EFL26_17515 [Nocardioides pocheonensis]
MASQAELERQLERLRDDSSRYQAASEAALAELAWVIDYLSRNRRAHLARQLRRNRASILRALGSDAPR